MLDEVLKARARTIHGGPGGKRLVQSTPWHPLWSVWLSISRVLDEPIAAATAAAAGILTMSAALDRTGVCFRSMLETNVAPLWLAILVLSWLIIAAHCALYFADAMCWAIDACVMAVLAVARPLSSLGLMIIVIIALASLARSLADGVLDQLARLLRPGWS